MTIEIFYLTAQIQRWLNVRVARHLAAQAERLAVNWGGADDPPDCLAQSFESRRCAHERNTWF